MAMGMAGYAVTLAAGIILAAVLVNPLAALVYLLVWIDILLLARVPMAESIGFETLTLAAVAGGIALGAAAGFLFAALGIPLLATLLNAAGRRMFSPRIPSVDFVAMGIAAALAPFLAASLPFIAAAFVAVFFKHFAMAAIRIAMGGGASLGPSTLNIIFSWLVLVALEGIGFLAAAGA